MCVCRSNRFTTVIVTVHVTMVLTCTHAQVNINVDSKQKTLSVLPGVRWSRSAEAGVFLDSGEVFTTL